MRSRIGISNSRRGSVREKQKQIPLVTASVQCWRVDYILKVLGIITYKVISHHEIYRSYSTGVIQSFTLTWLCNVSPWYSFFFLNLKTLEGIKGDHKEAELVKLTKSILWFLPSFGKG